MIWRLWLAFLVSATGGWISDLFCCRRGGYLFGQAASRIWWRLRDRR